MHLSIQTLLLAGRDVFEQFHLAKSLGFDGVEVTVGPQFDLAANWNTVRQASAASGVPVSAMCTHPIHDPLQPDATLRRERLKSLAEILEMAGELGARGVVSVPVRPARGFGSSAERNRYMTETTELAIEEFTKLAESLTHQSGALFLEPLNRYEATFLTRVDQATSIAQRIDHPKVLALADWFHMNIEESDIPSSLKQAGRWLGHVHIADNNRCQPGAGALDFRPGFKALQDIGYSGTISFECFPPDGCRISDAELAASVHFLRNQWSETVAGDHP